MTQAVAQLRPSNAQIDALARFLASRLPDWDYRQAAATESGLPGAQYSGDPRTGWRTLVLEAVEEGRVPALLRAASELTVGDPQLHALADSAEAGRLAIPGGSKVLVLAGAGAAAVGLAVMGLVGVALAVGGGASPEPAEVAAAAVVATVPAVEEVTPASDGSAAEAPVEDAKGAASVPKASAPKASAPKASPPKTPPLVADAGEGDAPGAGIEACGGKPGEIVGYMFYNLRAPRDEAEHWTTPRDLAVRADYPRRENGWKYDRAAVVCRLFAGTVLHLDPAHPALEVEGGAWWVPVIAGRLEAPSELAEP